MRKPHRTNGPSGGARCARQPFGLEHLEPRLTPAALGLEGPTEVVFEGEQADFALRLAQPSTRTETVFVTTSPGTATYGVDYMASARQQIVFAPGQTLQRFSISTLKEAVPRVEGVETFFVTATPANPNLSGPLKTTVRIADFQPKPAVAVGDISVAEGNSGATTATFTITLNATYAKQVTVSYATRDGSATAASGDYVAVVGSLAFAPGETSKTVAVTVTGDRVLEANETFSLVLSSPVNATVIRGTGVCTIRNDEVDAPGFQFVLTFQDGPGGTVPQSVRNAAAQAAVRWSRIITGDVPGVIENGLFVDDFNMVVQMGLLGGAPQGPGGILANAAPTAFRDNGNGLPYAGITGIDPNDINLGGTILVDTLAHEMGHALGFTPGAAVFSRWIVGNTFVGANALREYKTIFATTTAVAVPMQAGGAHWDENVFGNELMTPSTTGAPEYISRITIGALQDMGYTVNYAAAEPYVRPSGMTGQLAAGTGVTMASAFRSGSTPTGSTKPSQQAGQPVVVVRSVQAAANTGAGLLRTEARQVQKPATMNVVKTVPVVDPPAVGAKPQATLGGGLALAFARLTAR